jgi:glutathione-specific gamma-glutamylcyclotransferase
MSAPTQDLWVFAYGSLMWRPGFFYEEALHARLVGYRRCFCIFSVHHRGTPDRPGLVLGLDRGGTCEGIAYRIAATRADETMRYLRSRELINGVYRETQAPVQLLKGQDREVMAHMYIVERAHPDYAGALPLTVQASLVRGGKGQSGANLDYLINTLRHLSELGIRERALERLLTVIGAYAARRAGPGRESPAAAALLKTARAFRPLVQRHGGDVDRRFLYRLHLGG